MSKATLGGLPLLASSNVGWTFREGVAPSTGTFDMRPKYATALLAQAGKPIDLTYVVNGLTVTVKDLYVIHAAPQDQPQIAKVTVADRRWLWPHKRILRRYNMRRNIGVQRNQSIGNVGGLAPVDSTVWYWPWSVKSDPGIPWKAKEVLADVMAKVGLPELQWSGVTMPWIDSTPSTLNTIPFENFELLGESCNNALARVLAYLPGVGVKVREDGTVEIYDKTEGGEADVVKSLGPEVDGGGHVTLIDNRVIRPRSIIVTFQREIELRLDYTETSTTGTFAQPALEARYLDNVGIVTDGSLVVSGTQYATGTYLTFDQFFGAWAIQNGFTVNHSLVQKGMCPWFDLFADLADAGDFDPSADWVGRIGMILRCYRQMFRISARWMSRILSFRANRLFTVNQATGGRSPALVMADHAYIPSKRNRLSQPDSQYVAVNVDAYQQTLTPGSFDTVPSADMEIVDADQGIFAIRYSTDPIRMSSMILPSKITNPPNMDIRYPLRGNITMDSFVKGGAAAQLSPDYKMSVIFTAVPASPNTEQQLHRIVVTPAQAQIGIGRQIGSCDGPDMEIFIGPQTCTAKIQWLDGRSGDIELCFGIGVGEPNLQGLVLNETVSNATNGAALNNCALAAAVQIYATMLDRPQGTQAGHITPGIPIKGYIEEVRHDLNSKGVALTHVSIPGQIQPLSLKSYLDGSSLAAISHLVQPPGAS